MSQYQYQPCPQCKAPLDGWGECPQCGFGKVHGAGAGTYHGGYPGDAYQGPQTPPGQSPGQPHYGGQGGDRTQCGWIDGALHTESTVPPQPPPQLPRQSSGQSRSPLPILIVGLVVLLVGAVIAGLLVFALTNRGQEVAIKPRPPATTGNDQPSVEPTQEPTQPPTGPTTESTQPQPTETTESSPPPPTESSEPPPSSTAPPPTTSAPPPHTESRAVTVAYTCGRDGNGDCYLTERSTPTTSGASLKRWTEGTQLYIVCQVRGSRVRSSVTGVSSDVWSRTDTGGYVTNVYLLGVPQSTISTPCS